jgi:LytS/YehU family sensor histidine kinase
MQRVVLSEQLTRAHLDVLRARLHPHFLFNTLNTISMLVRDSDSETAVRLIAELGGLLRELLQSDAADEVTLEQELAFVERYLAIEQVRFGDRLRIERDIESDALDSVVPSLVLQPLVENALRHGLDRGNGRGTVRIGARIEGGELQLLVFDSKSRDSARAARQAPDNDGPCGFGLGLRTTRERLRRLHGERAQLRLTHSPAGTCAMLTLPRRVLASG